MLAVFLAFALQSTDPGPPIVVTGVKLGELRGDLDRCIASRCPARADIVASVRYAEGLFRLGNYVGARKVLGDSVRRNKGAAAIEPIALSELYQAQATVAAHHGEQRDYRSATYAGARLLRAALPGSRATLMAEMRVADLYVRDGETIAADRSYGAVRDRAIAASEPDIVAAVDLRRALLMHALGSSKAAIAKLQPLIASSGPAWVPLAARILAARIAMATGDDDAIDALVALLAAAPSTNAPTLLYSPKLDEPTQTVPINAFQRVDSQTRSTDLTGLQWVDVGFAIRSDGTVETPEVLRGSRSVKWAQPVLAMVAGRRYSPFAGDTGVPGAYRIERYTLTADFSTPVGSLIRRRIQRPRIEQIDLTPPTRVAAADAR